MSETTWLVAILVLPLALPAYILCLRVVFHNHPNGDRAVVGRYFDWLYAPFVFGLAGAYVATVGLSQMEARPVYLLGIPLGAGVYYVTTAAWGYYTDAPLRRGDRMVRLLLPGLGVPLPEEVLFREGLAPLIDVAGPAGYLAVSSIIFGLYHALLGLHEVVFKTLFGVLLGLAYLATGSVLAPVFVHFGYNLAWILYVTDRFL